MAERIGLQLLDGKKPEVPAAVAVPEGTTAEYAALLAIHEARGTPSYKRQVERFAESQTGLARAYARRWAGAAVPREDLEQAAVVGLLVAIGKWTPVRARGGWQKLAFWWMQDSVQQLVYGKELVREPAEVRRDRKTIERALRGAPDLTDQQLATQTGLTIKRVARARLPAPRLVFDEETS